MFACAVAEKQNFAVTLSAFGARKFDCRQYGKFGLAPRNFQVAGQPSQTPGSSENLMSSSRLPADPTMCDTDGIPSNLQCESS